MGNTYRPTHCIVCGRDITTDDHGQTLLVCQPCCAEQHAETERAIEEWLRRHQHHHEEERK